MPTIRNFVRSALTSTVLLLAVAHAHSQTLPDRIATTKVIRIAVNAIYPPMEFKDPKTGNLIGFDVDLGNALAKELGVTLDWQESAIEQVFPSLMTNRVDMVLSAVNDSPARRETMDFIDYLNSSAQFYALTSRTDVSKAADLCGKTVGTSRASSFPPKVKAWSDANCVAAGKPAISIEGTSDNAIARSELKQTRFDAAVQGSETLPYVMSLEPNTFKLIGSPFSSLYEGMAFRKNDTQLRDTVLAAFKKLLANGTYAAIVAKWNLESSGITHAAVNGAVTQ